MFFGRASSVWHSAKLTELRPHQKTPFGRMGRFNFAFIVCVSSVNGGMAPGEMETIFAAEYGFRMCSPFRLGSSDERRVGDAAKNFLFPTQRRRPVTSVRDECDERNSFEKSDLCTTLQVPAPVWMFEPLGGKSSAQTRKSEEKRTFGEDGERSNLSTG